MRIVNTKLRSGTNSLRYNEDKLEQTLPDGTNAAQRLISNVDLSGQSTTSRLETAFAARSKGADSRTIFPDIHLVIAFHPSDEVSNARAAAIALRVLDGMELRDNPFIVYRHFDQEHPHLHIVASRVRQNGKVVSDSFDKLKQRALATSLEIEFGLTRAEVSGLKGGVRKKSVIELNSEKTQQEMSPFDYIRQSFAESTAGRPALDIFLKRMRRRGIEVYFKAFTTRSGKDKIGVSYKLLGAETGEHFRIASPPPLELGFKAWPNGIPLAISGAYDPPLDFKARAVRASSLGPAFQFEGIKQFVDVGDSIPITTGPRHLKYKFRSEPMEFNENIAFRKLMVALELSHLDAALEAIREGAKINEIDPRELALLDPNLVKSLGERGRSIPQVNEEVELMTRRHLLNYQFANESTQAFFRAFVERDKKSIKELLKTIDPVQGVDPRSLSPDELFVLDLEVNRLVGERIETLNKMSVRESYLRSRAEHQEARAKQYINSAFSDKDHVMLRRALASNAAEKLIQMLDTREIHPNWIKDRKMAEIVDKVSSQEKTEDSASQIESSDGKSYRHT